MPKQPENTPMEPEHAKFDEIINTVSPDEMKKSAAVGGTPEKTLPYLPVYANAHPAGLLFRKKSATDSAGKSKTSTTATATVRKIC